MTHRIFWACAVALIITATWGTEVPAGRGIADTTDFWPLLKERLWVKAFVFSITNRRRSCGSFRGATDEPPWTDEQIKRIAKECRLIAFDCMTDDLKDPADDEHAQRPAPAHQEQW